MRRATETKVFQYVSEEGVKKAFVVAPLADNHGISRVTGYDLKTGSEVKLTKDDDIQVLHCQNGRHSLPAQFQDGNFLLLQSGMYKIYYRNDMLVHVDQVQLLTVKEQQQKKRC